MSKVLKVLSSVEVEKEFMLELKGLLEKWDARIRLNDSYRGYSWCNYDIIVEVPAIWTDNELVRSGVDIDLGDYITRGN